MFDWRRSHHPHRLLFGYVFVHVRMSLRSSCLLLSLSPSPSLPLMPLKTPCYPISSEFPVPGLGCLLRLASFIFPGSGFIPRASRASDSVAAFLLFRRQPTASLLAIFPAHVSPVPKVEEVPFGWPTGTPRGPQLGLFRSHSSSRMESVSRKSS